MKIFKSKPPTPNDTASPAGMTPDDVAFDALLRSAMQARPEAAAPSNLAARAMDLARAQSRAQFQAHTQSLARQRRWLQISGLAAAMLITALLAYGLLHARGDLTALASSMTSDSSSTADTSTASTATADTETSASATSNATSTNTIAVFFVGEVLLLGLLLLTVSRTGPTTPWGAEVARGLW